MKHKAKKQSDIGLAYFDEIPPVSFTCCVVTPTVIVQLYNVDLGQMSKNNFQVTGKLLSMTSSY